MRNVLVYLCVLLFILHCCAKPKSDRKFISLEQQRGADLTHNR